MYEKARFFLMAASLCVHLNLLLADSDETIEGLRIVGDGLEASTEGIVISNMLSLDDFFEEDDEGGSDENLDWIAVETDTINERLNKNGAGYVQIVDGERELQVSHDDGSPMHLSFVYSADDGSGHTMIPFAVSKIENPDYGYIIAVRNISKYPDENRIVEYKYWELYKLDSNGSLKNWNDVLYVESGIVAYEETFGQDLDGDMHVGLNLSALISIESDTKNELLKTNEEGEVYILGGIDDQNPILVVRPEGGAALLSDEYQWSWSEEIEGNTALRTQSVSRSPFAVAKQQDGKFSMIYIVNNRVDFKFDNDELNDSYEAETWSEYIVYSVSAEGVLDWEEEWTESILDYEPLFDQDFDGNGSAVGFTLAGLKFLGGSEVSDATSLRLVKEGVYEGIDSITTEGATYIAVGDFTDGRITANGSETPIKIVEEWGGAANLEYQHSWSDQGEGWTNSGTVQVSVMKIAELGNALKDEISGGHYLLVRKHLESFVYSNINAETGELETSEESKVNYDSFVLSSEGVINNEESYKWFNELEDLEIRYFVDVNQDGSVGGDPSSILFVESDTIGARLRKSDSGGLFVASEGEGLNDMPSPIVDEHGNYPYFEHTYSNSEYSHSEIPIAVEEKSDGGYWLAIRINWSHSYVDENSGEQLQSEDEQYRLVGLTSELVVDWSEELWVESVLDIEDKFNQDFNDDGGIGLSEAILTRVETDDSGLELFTLGNDGGILFEKEQGEFVTLKDEWGWTPSFFESYKDETSGFEFKKVPYAIEKDAVTGYINFIMRLEDSWPSEDGDSREKNVYWELGIADQNGVVQWDDFTMVTALEYEEIFGQDLNGDDSIGLNLASVPYSTMDSPEVDGGSNAYLRIDDSSGSVYVLDHADLENDGLLIPVTDSWGNRHGFRESHKWENGEHSAEPIAVEKIEGLNTADRSDDKYVLAVKREDLWQDPALPDAQPGRYISWEIITLSFVVNEDRGEQLLSFDWESSVEWSESIMPWEGQFGTDLNGDGGIGLVLENAPLEVDSSVEPAVLKVDSEGFLYIENLGETLAIKDSWGGRDTFEYEHIDQDSGYLRVQAPIAVAQNPDEPGGFLLITRNSSTWKNYEGELENSVDWSIVKIDSKGIFNWDDVSWVPSVIDYESIFKIDFNGDGSSEGLVLEALVYVETDSANNGSEAFLKRFPKANTVPKIPDPTSPSFIEYNSELYEIQEEEGYAAYFDHSYEDEFHSNKSTLIAVEPVEGEETFWLAIKHESQSTNESGEREDYANWQVLRLIGNSENSSATIKWEDNAWMQSIVSWEQIFNQDLDGDQYIGINVESLTPFATDTSGDLLRQDSSEGLYIQKKNGELVAITDEWGGMVNFNWTWRDGSNEETSNPFAIESQQDGSFILVVERKANWDDRNYVSYETFSVSSDGVVNRDSFYYTENLVELEEELGTDLNSDGIVGYSIEALEIVSGEISSIGLAKDSFGKFYILDYNSITPIYDIYGGSPDIEFTDSEDGGTFSRKAITIAKSFMDGDSVYQIFTRLIFTDQNSKENSYGWEVLETDSKGVLDYAKSQWTNAVYGFETSLNKDIDSNGVIGFVVPNLIDVSSDTKGAVLKTDQQGNLFISSNGSTIPVANEDGSQLSFSYEITKDNEKIESNPYAVEADESGGFKIAIKIVETNVTTSESVTNWETYNIKSNGTIEWESGAFGPAIASHEKFFDQDLNEDAKIGINEGDLNVLPNDTVGAILKKDSFGGLYIHDPENSGSYITIKDSHGSQPNLEYKDSDKWGSIESSGYAVEFQAAEENYALLIKEVYMPVGSDSATILWLMYSVSKTGFIDWTSEIASFAIASKERIFRQDLDLNGEIGEDFSSLLAVETDLVGEKAKTDSSGRLFIEKLDRLLLKITDDSGMHVSLDDAVVYAAEAVDTDIGVGYYILLKIIEESSEEFYWQRLYASADGVIDWTLTAEHKRATWLEDDFNQDIDGDGKISSRADQIGELADVETDTTGAILRKTNDGTLFIKDGRTTIPILDNSRGPVNLDVTMKVEGLSYSSIAMAVQAKRDGGYSVVVKDTFEFNEATEVSYGVYDISEDGELDKSSLIFYAPAGLNEAVFGQDINGDGVVSQQVSNFVADAKDKAVITSKDALDQASDTAQSKLYTLGAISSTKEDDQAAKSEQVTMYVAGAGQGNSHFDLEVSVANRHSEIMAAKTARDAGREGFTPLTEVLDFSVTITDPDKFGQIVSLEWIIPEGTENPVYLKRNQASGEYFDFKYDEKIREGYIYDEATRTMTVYIRDNGRYDDNPALGIVRDPAVLYAGDDETSADVDDDGIVDSSDYDDDSDGFSDVLEQIAGGDPKNPQDIQVTEEYLQSIGLSNSILASAVELGKEDVKGNPAEYGIDRYTEEERNNAVEAARAIVNVSARVDLGVGGLVTPGFTVLGQQKKMLVRAVGPKLADLGVGNPLPNPTMTIFKARWDGNPPDVIAVIDDWKNDNDNIAEIVSAMESAGAFPLEPAATFQGRPFMTDDHTSAAALLTLDIGVYTVQVSSSDNGVGEVLVEVYEITDDTTAVISSDSDNDGFTDDLELLAGGDPTDSTDVIKTESYLQQNNIPITIFESARKLGQQEVVLSPSNNELYSEDELATAVQSAKALVNVSARVDLGPEGLVTPGFTVLGQQKKMLIRAVGPKLADLGVGNPLPNPTMTVYKARWDGNPPDVVAVIDDWKKDNDNVVEIVSAMEAAGAFPLQPTDTFQGRPFMTDDSKSAVAFLTLGIGVYTVQVKSADDGIGEVLVEVYEVTD